MGSLVFVTTEIFPFTAGGIGRVLYNMLKSMDEADRARSVVVLVNHAISKSKFEAVFPQSQLICIDSIEENVDVRIVQRHPPQWAYSDSSWHWLSAKVLRCLKKLAQTESIDYVEFPDWGGLGFCSLQERRFSGLLSTATMAVRLHSSHTVLMHAEAYAVGLHDLNLSDLERKCLRDCDRIVAQLPHVAESVRLAFGFDTHEWAPRLVVHAPPVLIDHHSPVVQTAPGRGDLDILFTSKVQRFKRPDLFVRGVAGLMRREPGFTGRAVFCAHSRDPSYEAQVLRMIPLEVKDRFVFEAKLEARAREERIAGAVVVIPSVYESFCLAAYEASLLGARLVLNGNNPAFDDGSPWRDGVNCVKFDGTSTGLTGALLRSLDLALQLEPVNLPNNPWPWLDLPPASQSWREPIEWPLVSVVVPHFNLGSCLPETLENIATFDYPNLEVVVVDDASTDSASRLLMDLLADVESPQILVERLTANVGLAAARNVGVSRASGQYVLTLDADDLMEPGFIRKAVVALENNPEFGVVVTSAAYFVDGEEIPYHRQTDAVDYAVFTGEARLAGLLENRHSTATAVFRRPLLQKFAYIEDLRCYEDWSLYMRLVEAQVRFVVSTEASFYYRKRANSMVHAPRDKETLMLDYSDLMRTSAPHRWRSGSNVFMLGITPPVLWEESKSVSPIVNGVNEQYRSVLRIEAMVEQVYAWTAPLGNFFRLPKFIWRKLHPLRSAIARWRGRI